MSKSDHVQVPLPPYSIVASLVFKKGGKMDERAKNEDKAADKAGLDADPTVQKFLTLLAEIIVELTLQAYEQQKRHCIPPDQSGAAK
jgi:hypothetical protein